MANYKQKDKEQFIKELKRRDLSGIYIPDTLYQTTMERTPLKVIISGMDIPDFYLMLRDFARHRGNTFTYLRQELEQMYPELPRAYGDILED